MKRILSALMAASALWALSAAVSGCGIPEYPKCEKDDHCREHMSNARGTGKEVFCVQGVCVQCRGDGDCGAGQECRNGQCYAKPECRSNAECPAGMLCKGEKCVPECMSEADCPPGLACQNNRCVPKVECTMAEDCPAGKTCVDGRCVTQAKQVVECTLDRIHFDFDRYDIRSDQTSTLESNAKCLKEHPEWKAHVVGHCDERGTTEYNMALGSRRSKAAADYLKRLGVEGKRLRTSSQGEEEPLDPGHNEDAWAKNRRAEFNKE